MNGELVRWEDAKVHVLTHALHYGSGVFEGIRAYETERGTAVFRHREHLERLRRSAELYYMELPYTLEKLREATHELIRANKLRSCYIRPIAYRGYGEMGLFPLNAPGRRRDRRLAVGRLPRRGGPAARRSAARSPRGGACRPTASSRRRRPSGQYLNSILAKVETAKAGYDEAILLDDHGNVSRGLGREHLHGARRRDLHAAGDAPRSWTASRAARSIQIAADLGFEVVERDIARGELYQADEVFLTGTAAEVVPVREVDDHRSASPARSRRRSRRASSRRSRASARSTSSGWTSSRWTRPTDERANYAGERAA